MPDIPNRAELERKIARLLGRFNKTQLGDLLEMMGNSPKMNKIPPSFWTESEQALAAELVPFSEMVYLEAAERVVDSVPLPIGFDWTLVNQDAADWAVREVGKLVTKITDTTRKRIGSAVSSYFTETQTIGDLEKQLARMKDRFGNILGPKRAEMISVTEITRAASQGELGVARQLKNEGIEMRKVWQTNKDDLVCETICEPLQGVEESTWRSVAPDGPPAHVRCRCFLSLLLPRVRDVSNILDISRTTDIDNARSSINNALDNGNLVTKKLHGMSNNESFTQISYRDWSVNASNNLEREYIQNRIISIEQAYREHENIGNLYNQTKELWLTSQQHSGIAGANATGGNGVVVLYKRDFIDVAQTLTHESGHNLSSNLFQSISPGDDYLKAVIGEKAPTSYALVNSAEDFAESATLYFFENERLLRTAPKRFNYFSELFTK